MSKLLHRVDIPDWAPLNRVIHTIVGKHNVSLRIFSHKEGGRYFQAVFSHEQLAQIAHLADQARRGAYAEEFITGADDELLAFHKLAAKAETGERRPESSDSAAASPLSGFRSPLSAIPQIP